MRQALARNQRPHRHPHPPSRVYLAFLIFVVSVLGEESPRRLFPIKGMTSRSFGSWSGVELRQYSECTKEGVT
jgi:hypothetical protein